MASRRMRPRGRRRTKVLWDRAWSIVPLLAFGTPTSQVIGDPTILPGSAVGFDQNRTIRRIRLNCHVGFSNDLPPQAITGVYIFGVYVADSDSPVRSPGMTTSQDVETDWLDLWQTELVLDAVGVGSQTLQTKNMERDIRVNRKLTNDENIVFTALPATEQGAIALNTGFILLQQSLLWTATPT